MYIKCMSVTKIKCPIIMKKISKCEICENFGPLIKHGPHWINLSIFTFISEKNRYFRCLYQIWNIIISFDMEKKGKFKTCHKKSEETSEFESLRQSF
jgi:hypothetical protein